MNFTTLKINNMELNNKISIKRVIEAYPELSNQILNSDTALETFAGYCNLPINFIKLHLDTIKRWI